MHIGIPKEIKKGEHRVGLVPASVREIISHGHSVVVEQGAGEGVGCDDAAYQSVGATLVASTADVYAQAELIVKVKEPQPPEIKLLQSHHILFTYLHLAPDLQLTKALQNSGCIAIAYETVTDAHGHLPLLTPMSEVAGRLSIQVGAFYLQKQNGGKGILLGGVPGVSRGKVVIIGGGVVGSNAIRMALGREAEVTVLECSLSRLQELDDHYGGRLNTIFATAERIEKYVTQADLVVGAVLLPGHKTPRLISRELLENMQSGTVLVDVSIDQGGCFTSSRVTTFEKPTFIEQGIVHYCVANMPGAVPRTSSLALNIATLPFVLMLADKGYQHALTDDRHFMQGLNVFRGQVTCEAVAADQGVEYLPPSAALALS